MPVVMTRPQLSAPPRPGLPPSPPSPRRATLLLGMALVLAPGLPAVAQETIPTATRAPTQRAALPVPATPDLSTGPLPTAPDQSDIAPAPAYELPAPRLLAAAPPTDGIALPPRVAGEQLSLRLTVGQETLPDDATPALADVAIRLRARPAERLDVRAFATGPADRATDARRTALLRARAVRDRLVSQGIDPLRLNIFAEGTPLATPAAGQPLPVPDPKAPAPDRVDLVFRP